MSWHECIAGADDNILQLWMALPYPSCLHCVPIHAQTATYQVRLGSLSRGKTRLFGRCGGISTGSISLATLWHLLNGYIIFQRSPPAAAQICVRKQLCCDGPIAS